MRQHFNNGLTDAQSELLTLLAEECAETIQAVAKIQRHGYESFNPLIKDLTNRGFLEKELGHLKHAGALSNSHIEDASIEKACSIGEWLHHQ